MDLYEFAEHKVDEYIRQHPEFDSQKSPYKREWMLKRTIDNREEALYVYFDLSDFVVYPSAIEGGKISDGKESRSRKVVRDLTKLFEDREFIGPAIDATWEIAAKLSVSEPIFEDISEDEDESEG